MGSVTKFPGRVILGRDCHVACESVVPLAFAQLSLSTFGGGGGLPFQIRLRLGDRVTRVIFWVGLVSRAEVGNPSNYFFGFVAASHGAFCIGPIVLRLAQRGTGIATAAHYLFIVVSGSFL